MSLNLNELAGTRPDNGATRAKAPGRQRSNCGSVRRERGGDRYSQRRNQSLIRDDAKLAQLVRARCRGLDSDKNPQNQEVKST